MEDAWIFVFSLVDGMGLLFLCVYFIITLSDLECDYINATTCCSRLNRCVLPELIAHTVQTVLMLISWHWFLFLLNLPLAAFQTYRYFTVPSGNIGVYDPVEIHNHRQLKSMTKESLIKLGYHLVLFFAYLYSLIQALLSWNDFTDCLLNSTEDLFQKLFLSSSFAYWTVSFRTN